MSYSNKESLKEILEFCKNGHDIDGTPVPFLLRSFAYDNKYTMAEFKIVEHNMRIKYLEKKLAQMD
jgi:hypothetical protein